MSLIEVKNLTYKYDKFAKDAKNAINNISFNVEKEDFVAIVGKTGSGKSTIISHLNGILKADSGLIFFDGKNIYDKDYDLNKLRFNVGVVFQYPEYQLFEEKVIDDICFGAIKKGLTKEMAIKEAHKIMRKLGIEYLENASPFVLSGGEKRKVALAGILVMEPDVLILDEPEAGLDSVSKRELFDLLKNLNVEKHVTIIFITHNVDDAVEYANKVMIIYNGEIKAYRKTEEIFYDNKLLDECEIELPYAIEIVNKFSLPYKDKIKFDDIVKQMEHRC